jgi:multicomponent Na+:H+ antiporter subunit G
MTAILELLSNLCLMLGGVLCITGGVGLLRMPDFFSRVHASGVTETLAAPLLLIGLLLQMEWSLDSVKVIMILILVLVTNPTATHAMAKATLHGGQRPLVFDDDEHTGGEGTSKP